MAVVSTAEIEIILNGKKAKIGLDDFKKRFLKLTKSVKTTNALFGKLAKIASIGFMAKMAIDSSKFARSMGLLSERLGIATSKMLGMRTAFSAMGGNAKSLEGLLSRISSGLAGLSMGDGEMASKLAAMGINAWGKNGKVKTPDQVFGDMADWTKRSLAAGRSVAEVFRYLSQNFGVTEDDFQALRLGRGGWEAKQKELNAQTGVAEERQINNLRELNQSWVKLKATIDVIVQKVSGDLAPVIKFFADIFQYALNIFQDVWKSLTDCFRAIIGDGEELSEVFKGLKKVVKVLADIFKFLIDNVIGPFFWSVKKIGEWIGNFLAWMQQKFGWFFSSPKSKDQQRDMELNQQALANPELKTLEDRLRWMASKGSNWAKDTLAQIEANKNLEPYVDDNGNIIDVSQIQDLPDANQAVKASNTGGNTIVNLDVNNSAQVNPDGSVTQTTEINGESVTASGNNMNMNYVTVAQTGGHA